MKRNLLLLILAILVLASCKKDEIILPTASFTFTLSQNQAPASVYVNNTSTNADHYLWETSDGKTSTEYEPEFIFSSGGSYEITLHAYNKDGSAGYSKSFVIENKPAPSGIHIEGIQFTNIPLTGWDSFSGPDVYFKVWLGNILVVDGQDYRIKDVTSETIPYCVWSFSPPMVLLSDAEISLAIYDYDDVDSDDLMASTNINLSDYTSYPTTITKTVNGMSVNLIVTWVY